MRNAGDPRRALIVFLVTLAASFCLEAAPVRADSPEIVPVPVDQPVTVNGDTVEYLTESKQVQAQGKVAVDYKGTLMRCDKLTVNTQTKDAVAEGNVRIEDKGSVLEGEKIIYNFNTKVGSIVNAKFASAPFYGQADKLEKLDDTHFVALKGYATTCDYDRPHFRLKSRKVDMYPGKKISASDDTLLFAAAPVFYTPYMKHGLGDRNMIAQLSPGYSKGWGAYLLSVWRYNVNDNVNGRVFLDYREKLGFAEGFGANFSRTRFGSADLKFYYTQERPESGAQGGPGKFERYFARFRHRWDIDPSTSLVNEYYKITDAKRANLGADWNILKDYFPREFERDSQPISYSLLTHNFSQSSANALFQKRINPWFDSPQFEKLPEFNYSLPSLQLGELPLYFDHTSQVANYSVKHKVPAAENADYNVSRLDTVNKLSLPMKVSFIDIAPFAGFRETYYDRGVDGKSVAPRTIFNTGSEISTKFYRIYETQTNFLNLDINGLRHIITPRATYNYNPEPGVSSPRLKQVDSVDTIGMNNSVDLELSNKLQTKREGKAVELADFIIDTSYIFHKITYTPDYNTDSVLKDTFNQEVGNYIFKLEFFPYNWMSFYSDAEYDRKERHFNTLNYDFAFNHGKDRSVSFGQRYAKGGGDELTLGSDWRLTPKWKLHLYERYQIADRPELREGLVKQEYGFTRDLHCWLMDFNFSIEKEHGRMFWVMFRLKAFPEAAIDFSQSYSVPKLGSNYTYRQ